MLKSKLRSFGNLTAFLSDNIAVIAVISSLYIVFMQPCAEPLSHGFSFRHNYFPFHGSFFMRPVFSYLLTSVLKR